MSVRTSFQSPLRLQVEIGVRRMDNLPVDYQAGREVARPVGMRPTDVEDVTNNESNKGVLTDRQGRSVHGA